MRTEIQAQHVKRLLLRIYRRYQGGEISETQANKEAYLLNSVLKAIEATNLEKKYNKTEGKLFEVRIIDSTSTNG